MRLDTDIAAEKRSLQRTDAMGRGPRVEFEAELNTSGRFTCFDVSDIEIFLPRRGLAYRSVGQPQHLAEFQVFRMMPDGECL